MKVMTALALTLLSAPLLSATLLSATVQASEVTQRDIQIIGRTLGFMEDLRTGPLDLGIVYIRGDAESQRQAASIQAMLADTPVVGKISLRAQLVAAEDLSALSHADALFVVPAAGQADARAATAGRRLHVPVISTDQSCAEAGNCVISFSSTPTVEIVFNRSSAEAAGVHFTAAFRMLVKKL
jgi:hypothetical protein